MQSLALSTLRGRVLVIGGKSASEELLEKLSGWGYFCAVADTAEAVATTAASLRPEVVLLAADPARASELLSVVRGAEALRGVPVLADLSRGPAEALRGLGVDDFVHSPDELTRRLEAALRAQRLVARDQLSRLRMEMLLEITQAATSSLELDDILSLAVEKIGRVVPCDRCSVVLVEGSSPRLARVVASRAVPGFSPFQLDLARYPELRRALESRRPVHVEDAARDPLMEEVRRHIVPLQVKSILVQPLVCHDDVLGALFLRLSKSDASFGRDERDFAEAAAAALANSIRNARLHAALKRKRDDLESAYVDRYRELGEANQRLKQANRLKDDLLAVCSHDLRAPLQVLLGHGRILADSELSQQEQGSVDAIVRMGKKILGLVESLLERGKGDRSRISLEPRLLDVAEVCKEAALELGILATERGVTLRAETPETLMAIGDEMKLRQVLQNLITNAITHAQKAGQVTVRVQRLKRPDGEVARVAVQDDGEGLAREKLQLVFDKYQHEGTGSGLGLAICKEFIELHGGEIWAELPESGGCAFVFTLPLAKAPQPAVRRPPPVAEAQAPLVLVVEDEPEVAAVISEILRTRFRVDLARDGEEALAKTHALHPDLVVMDVFLPKLDGLDAVMALKSASDTSDIPVILLSAHQGVSDKVRALNLGAVDYMGKPFQALELLSRVERALRLKDTESELQRSLSLLRRGGNDPETGLLDRAGFLARVEQELSRAKRYARPLSLAVLRPAGAPGDKTRDAALLLRRRARAPDVLCHLGDGVIAILLPESPPEAVRRVLARLLPEVQAETGVAYGSSVAEVVTPGQTAESVLDGLLKVARGS
ncbi:MAG: ATP-binding protein [Myxococcaceae bacterium]